MTITNRTPNAIVQTDVLIDTKLEHPKVRNRLFNIVAQVQPYQIGTVEGFAMDSVDYDFKDVFQKWKGCEVERLTFADGTAWEQTSPL